PTVGRAAVGGRHARTSRLDAAQPRAARYADVVRLARIDLIAVARAAVARLSARHVLQLADLAVRLARVPRFVLVHRVRAESDRASARDGAGAHVTATAIRVLRAKVARHVATARRLAHEQARRSEGRA